MTDDEQREIRKLLLAFEDASTWCEGLMARVRQFAGMMRADQGGPEAEITRALVEADEVERHLRADREEVLRIRGRLGLPPSHPGR
jgi:hypothetical protein